jgi:citronellyl-CoA dehydrogenase
VPDPKMLDMLEQVTAQKLDSQSTALYGSANLWDDGLIDPRDTRTLLGLLDICHEADSAPLQPNSLWRQPGSDGRRSEENNKNDLHPGTRSTAPHRPPVRRARDQPARRRWEKAGRFPIHEIFRKAGDLGLLGISKPEKFGGMGLDYSYSIVAAEEFGTIHCGGIPMSIGVQTDMCTPALARFGSDELRDEFLRPAITGEQVGCIGVSEVGAGSDVAGLKTTARKDGDDYVINGSKMWITNSPSADFICLLANTSDDKPHINKSLIMVPMTTPGISLSSHLDKLGMRSSETAQVFFDNVRVPQRNRIGHEGAGFMMQMLQFQEERLFGAANMIKGLEYCVDSTIEYCKERKTFGNALIDNQVIHFRLAELQTEIECLRALVYQATEQYVRGQDVTRLASMAKLKAGRLGREVSDSCLQYWGGMGFMWDNPVARAYRDVRLVSIGGGADEIMLGIICKLMGILPGKKNEHLPDCQTLLLELHNGVLHITLNRPESRNAMSLQMVAELRAVLAAVRDDRAMRALVIGGAGGHFCAGGDIKDMANARAQGGDAYRDLNRVFGALLRRGAARAASGDHRPARRRARRWLWPGLCQRYRHGRSSGAIRPAGNQPRPVAGANRSVRGPAHRPDPGPATGADGGALRWHPGAAHGPGAFCRT